MITLFALFLTVVLLYLALRLVSMVWRGVEQVLNELVSGLRLFCVLAWRAGKYAVIGVMFARRYAKRGGLCLARRAHAALFTWVFVLKRRYVASELRKMRRERHA